MEYKSAHDLPSFIEASQQLRGLSLLRFILPKSKRPDIKELRKQLKYIGDTVDNFYDVLGPRNWIFHDMLPLDDVAEILDNNASPQDVEEKIIAIYNDPDRLPYMLLGLRRLPAMAKRMELVEKAQNDYFSGRYYACIHVLLSVMDGFVNEFEIVRRGLHAREAEELRAWDSVVGHHMGLTNAHKTFTKGKSATNEEPIDELYRNGIVHGSQLNYDNVVVATKAWNRLFAVVDWAKATLKRQQPAPEKPTWKGITTRLVENDKIKRANEAWEPSSAFRGHDDFSSHVLVLAADGYLDAWVARNYGQMSKAVSSEETQRHGNALPRLIRLAYESVSISGHEVKKVEHSAPAICLVTAELELTDGSQQMAQLRWIYENDSGKPTPSTLPGTWRLLEWDPYRIMR